MDFWDKITKFRGLLDSSVDFKLPIRVQEKIQSIVVSFNNKTTPLPQLERLKPLSESKKDWWQILAGTILDSVQEGLAAAYYHQQRIELIEHAIIEISVGAINDLQLPQGSTFAPGALRKLNFEYQAYLFAIRRTLEYFAVSVGAFFKCDVHRIRKLYDTIHKKEPLEFSEKVCEKLIEGLGNIVDIMPLDKQLKGSRDILAHYKSVQAGTLNISNRENGIEIGLWGGGENLNALNAKSIPAVVQRIEEGMAFKILSPTIKSQLKRVEQLVFEIYNIMGFCAIS